MSKLPRLSGSELLKLLCNKAGFAPARAKGSHVLVKKILPTGAVIAFPIPIHAKDLKPSLLSHIIKQAGLTHDEFIELYKGVTAKEPPRQ